MSSDVLTVNQGSLYPALHRLERHGSALDVVGEECIDLGAGEDQGIGPLGQCPLSQEELSHGQLDPKTGARVDVPPKRIPSFKASPPCQH